MPPVAPLYQCKIPDPPVAVSVTVPGPHLVTGLLVEGAAGNGLTVTVTGDEFAEHPFNVAVAV